MLLQDTILDIPSANHLCMILRFQTSSRRVDYAPCFQAHNHSSLTDIWMSKLNIKVRRYFSAVTRIMKYMGISWVYSQTQKLYTSLIRK